ncbi:tol-pal system YbgF family protein [Shewanella maritima]|uniref:tetratricopeptide repeat protein n=1 Tax=Shewanella maritima TaxID=2520507 RepID=UPI0037366A6C
MNSINVRLSAPRSILALAISLGLTACSHSPSDNQPTRSTLGQLANNQSALEIDGPELTEKQRQKKLSRIYQQLLDLEPNQQVRTAMQYRLAQINTEMYETNFFEQLEHVDELSEQALSNSSHELQALIDNYQLLLIQYPNKAENEHIRYQLAKAYDLQGKQQASLREIEHLLADYPNTHYFAEVNFRRGEIYYNLQQYQAAINAYKQVIDSHDQKYRLNSLYMSGWSLFKLNHFVLADQRFIQVLEQLANKAGNINSDFHFDTLPSQYQSLAIDTQRVLSISLSQQGQSASLVSLVNDNQHSGLLANYQHVLFQNLAQFLLDKELKHDAELTYQAYIDMSPSSIWAARFSIDLLKLYQSQAKFASINAVKLSYLQQFGLQSRFWHSATDEYKAELLPHLLHFSEQQSRQLYADAQIQPQGKTREIAFNKAAQAIQQNLALAFEAKHSVYVSNQDITEALADKKIMHDQYLLAEAQFEAKQFNDALNSYHHIAYAPSNTAITQHDFHHAHYYAVEQIASRAELNHTHLADIATETAELKQQAALATTVAVREIMLSDKQPLQWQSVQTGIDEQYIWHYPVTDRALELATYGVEQFKDKQLFESQLRYSLFVLASHQILAVDPVTALSPNKNNYISSENIDSNQVDVKPITTVETSNNQAPLAATQLKPFCAEFKLTPLHETGIENYANLSSTAKQQVQIITQHYANTVYQQEHYQAAEQAYNLALKFVTSEQTVTTDMRGLLASSIYFQAQSMKQHQPLAAVEQLLRIAKVVPESSHRINAEYEAANILLANQEYQAAIDVLLTFTKQYPKHHFSQTIPAKLAQAYEALEQWELAGDQLMVIIAATDDSRDANISLKREALYTAAEYFLKAGKRDKALSSFRTYVHTYPQPFDVAQEVRLQMSKFYQESNEPNKEYFWYRKILSAHQQQMKVANVNARGLFLASTAAFNLGKAHQASFTAIKLTLPLQKNLKRKQSEMKLAIGYFQQVLDLNIAEYVPNATYQLAQMYRILATDIMESQRPTDLDELALEEYEILLEELAYPLEEKAIEIHISNSQRAWQNNFDQWIANSFTALAEMSPALYLKQEQTHDAVETIY